MTLLWQLISPFAGYIAAAGLALAAWFGNAALNRRKGRKAAEADAAAKAARDTIKAHEVRNEVETDVARGNARDRLRSGWRE